MSVSSYHDALYSSSEDDRVVAPEIGHIIGQIDLAREVIRVCRMTR